MYRFAQEQISKWKDSQRRKPLIVRGTRQVGKTWLVEHVAAAGFESMVKIDLEKRRDLHGVFGDNLDPRFVVQHLELDSGTRILPGRTLLFLDEIQASPAPPYGGPPGGTTTANSMPSTNSAPTCSSPSGFQPENTASPSIASTTTGTPPSIPGNSPSFCSTPKGVS